MAKANQAKSKRPGPAEAAAPDPLSQSRELDQAEAGTREFTLLVQRQEALEKPETRREARLKLSTSGTTSVLGALRLARQAGEALAEGSVAFEGDCHEGVCGGCAMLVNGKVALACGVRLSEAADKQGCVRLAPMKRFPLVRDLVVDRSRIQRTLESIPMTGPRTPDTNPRALPPTASEAMERLGLDQCHRCGACLEACPAYGVHSEFVGALTLHEVRLRNDAGTGRQASQRRIEAMMAPGGVHACGNAQNCVEVCPAKLPLVDSIQSVARQTTRQLFGWLLG